MQPNCPVPGFTRELHLSRAARRRYGFDDSLFALNGTVIIADFQAARVLAARINAGRAPEEMVSAAALNAAGLIDEALHLMFREHRQRNHPSLLQESLEALDSRLGRDRVNRVLELFTDRFPPLVVYRRERTPAEYLAASTDGEPNRAAVLEELLFLRLANLNPAFRPLAELFSDAELCEECPYEELMTAFEGWLEQENSLGPAGVTVLDLLRAPMLAAPDSLDGQLEYLRVHCSDLVGVQLHRILSSLDFLAEESKPFFGFGPGPVKPPSYEHVDPEPQAYSPDLHWMPRVVMLAKNVHVWMHQLSERHGRPVTRLDEIPDAELDTLAAWGISGLWLIGLWQRSRASEKIKRWMGDREAVASAYSLADYEIADDLGGQEAYDALKGRAWRRGVRLASDMVPNHMGIDSRWMIEHPDWFVGLDHSPFPAYRFDGEDLCDDQRVGIYLENGYWDRSDAAVVFKRVDQWTGAERYIYHGNDGTTMPWNDTAQLDYLNPEVREGVIQTILHVARLSPIIRFDAAMTLAKRHYHRLWVPEPGTGGDIPSRSDFGMTQAEFDEVMPVEFWREVVDRVATEAPDTLLLAEAFWMLEGYFVRSLGMHRVYNSAFMNMLCEERNADYRVLIKNTLEFDPQILKRYVNFMSNPDERTAIDQFGDGDKYFGVCVLMATLPGLPMFGHGQIEGLREKYGMEFRTPRWQESANEALVARHEQLVFPLLHRRHLFADVDAFRLYDFVTADGAVDENVFAFSNASGGERALIVYHNRFADTHGRLVRSTGFAVAGTDGGDPKIERESLAHGLGLVERHRGSYVVLRDQTAELEALIAVGDLLDGGLELDLGAYELRVYLDPRIVTDDHEGKVSRLAGHLGGRPVVCLDVAARELELKDVLVELVELMPPSVVARLTVPREKNEGDGTEDIEVLEGVEGRLRRVLESAAAIGGHLRDLESVVDEALDRLVAVASLTDFRPLEESDESPPSRGFVDEVTALVETEPKPSEVLVAWVLGRGVVALTGEPPTDRRLVAQALMTGAVGDQTDRASIGKRAVPVEVLMACEGWRNRSGADGTSTCAVILEALLNQPAVRRFLDVNRHRGVEWFNHEAFDDLLGWLLLGAAVELSLETEPDPSSEVERVMGMVEELRRAEAASGYRVEALLAAAASLDSSADPTA